MTLAIGFGRDAVAARSAADGSLARGFRTARVSYDAGWNGYLTSLKAPPAPVAGNAQLVPGQGRRVAGQGGELDRDDQRPLLAQALLPAGHEGRQPRHNGEGTRSATPLAWTHAQYVRLAWSIQAGQPIERPAIVACRYQKQLCP